MSPPSSPPSSPASSPASNPPPTLSRLRQIAMTVSDLDRSTAFFRETLGVPFLFGAPGMSFFDLDGVRLMLGLPEGDAPVPGGAGSILYFQVEDIERVHGELRNRGVEFESGPHAVHRTADHELWLAFFRDPDGHLLALMSEVGLDG